MEGSHTFFKVRVYVKNLSTKMNDWSGEIIEFLISDPLKINKNLTWLFLFIIYLSGVFLFNKFLTTNVGSIYFHDWSDITLPRLTFIKDSITTGQLPLHSGTELFLGNIRSTRFLAIPDAIISPQLILLKWISVSHFIKIQVFLMYTLGFWGLLVIQQKFKLSLLVFYIVFVLFFFNGSILAHLSVGHLSFASYFLLSWFVLFIFNLLDGEKNLKWITQIAGLFFIMLLQGGYHQVFWCFIFMGLLAIFMPSKFFSLTKAVFAALMLGAVRILPEISLLGSFNTAFLGGYSYVWNIWTEMVAIDQPAANILVENSVKKIGLWEMTLFIGVVGAVFIIYFGIVQPLLHRNEASSRNYVHILLPVFGIILFSLYQFAKYLHLLVPLPIISSERVSSRMIIIAFVLILVLAAIEYQAWLNSKIDRRFTFLGSILILGIGLSDLLQNFMTWRLSKSSIAFPPMTFEPDNWFVANNYGDTAYLSLIILGTIVSTLTLIIMVILNWRIKSPPVNIADKNRLKPV